MNKLFPLPFFTFLKTVSRNGGVTFKGLRNLPPWLTKTVLFEPIRWVELTKNARVEKHVIEQDPIFILGFYRSGTSFMHEFLTQDERLGYHTNFQMVMPEIMLSAERTLSPVLETIAKTFNIQDHVHRIRLSFKYPGEDDAAMTTALNPRGAQWGYFYPELMMEQFRKYVLFEGISEEELEAWKTDYLFLLKKISLAADNRQLILKSPPNTARVKLLLSLFPKAKFIMVHRNPYDVYSSNKRFWQVTHRVYALGRTKTVDVNRIILDTYAETMQRYLDEKHLIPEGQLIEVPYADLIAQPLERMRGIYGTLSLPEFGEVEAKMGTYLEGQKSYKRLKHELPAEERERVSDRFEPFIKHWDYPVL